MELENWEREAACLQAGKAQQDLWDREGRWAHTKKGGVRLLGSQGCVWWDFTQFLGMSPTVGKGEEQRCQHGKV